MTVEEYRIEAMEECEEVNKIMPGFHNDCTEWLTMELDPVIVRHIEKFGVAPKYIGANWDMDRDDIKKLIEESIEKGIPYDEYEMMSEEEKRQFDNGEFVF